MNFLKQKAFKKTKTKKFNLTLLISFCLNYLTLIIILNKFYNFIITINNIFYYYFIINF